VATRAVAEEAPGRLKLALEAPGPLGPRNCQKAKFWLAIAKSWLQLELNIWFI